MKFPLVPFKHSCIKKPTCCNNSTLCAACYELFKVVALADGTTVTRYGSVKNETFTLNALEWRMVLPLQSEFSYLVANKPLQVVQFIPAQEYEDDREIIGK